MLINPDNPSGNFIPLSDLLELIGWAKRKGISIIVDESFVDFSDIQGRRSLLDNSILVSNPHLIVVKSISKSYGVPGLRLGILASGNTDLIGQLKRDVSIWNINSFGEFYMQIFEKYHKDYDRACALFRAERDALFKELSEIPYLRVYPSQANYFLCKVTSPETSRGLALKLLKRGILIKDCSTKKAFRGENYIRIAVRDRKDNVQLIQALQCLR